MTGSGTQGDPFIISTVQDLQDMKNSLAAYYELEHNIDASETAIWNGGQGFEPVGTYDVPFAGHFDGKNHEITELYIHRPDTSYVGLFGYVEHGTASAPYPTFKDVTFEDCHVVGLHHVGTLMGAEGSYTGTDRSDTENVHGLNCYVEGTGGNIGGLVGSYIHSCYVSYCSFIGTIIGSYDVGGIAGTFAAGIYGTLAVMYRCFAIIQLTGAYELGGVIGMSYKAEIGQCFSEGSLEGHRNIGGLIGYEQTQVELYDCYTRARVKKIDAYSQYKAGGFAGRNYGILTRAYAAGLVEGYPPLGGFLGEPTTNPSASFWDVAVSGQTGCICTSGATGLSTALMKTESTFTDAGWDFVHVWAIDPDINDGYPYLLWYVQPIVPPRLIVEYSPASPAIPPKLTIDFDPGVEPMPAKLIVEHEYILPVPPKLIIEHSAPIIPMPPKLTVEFSEAEAPQPPKLVLEWAKPTIPVDLAPGIQIYVNDIWEDISQYVMNLHIKRGRMHELDRVEAGTATMLLNNEAGQFWRYNPDSVYYPDIKPLVPVRVIMVLGEVLYSLYNGVIEAWHPSWAEDIAGGLPVMNIDCVDMFKRFSRAFIRTARPAELSGARIDAILDHIGWPLGEDWRSIDAGIIMISELPLDEANPENALNHMLDVALSEGGIFFMDGAGRAVFQDANSRITGANSVTKATLTKDDFLPVRLSDDDTMIYNSAQINNQFYQIIDVDPLIGSREYKETLPLASETEALARAYIIAQRYKDSILRLPAIPIVPANNPERLYPMIYGYDLSTRLRVELDDPQYPSKLEQNYHIEGIQHRWDARSKLWRTDWQLWEVSQFRRALMLGCAYAICTRIIYQSIPGYVGVWPHSGNLDPYNNDSIIYVGQQSGLNGIYISRGLIEFDTSGITADVAEAHVFLCFSILTQGELDRDIKIVLVDPGSLVLPLQTGDYGVLHTKDTILGESAAFHSARDGQWIEIELNAAGIYHIEKGGITRFGIRSNHDINADKDDLQDGTILFENAKLCGYGAGKEPYLVARLNI